MASVGNGGEDGARDGARRTFRLSLPHATSHKCSSTDWVIEEQGSISCIINIVGIRAALGPGRYNGGQAVNLSSGVGWI